MDTSFKVLLIQPPYKSRVVKARNNILPPLGLGYIAGKLLSHGFDVEILDALALGLSIEQIGRHVIEKKPDLVGVTALVPSSKSALDIMKHIKKLLPDSINICGGAYFGLAGEETLKCHRFVDIVCMREGEDVTLEIANILKDAKSQGISFYDSRISDHLQAVKGIQFRKESEIITTDSRPPIENLDDYRVAWELLPCHLYTERGIRQIIATSSRGCVQRCNFCTQWRFWGKWRTWSPERVVNEMELLSTKYGFESIRFGDEEFLVNKERVVNICNEILRRNLKVAWACQASTELIVRSEDIIPLMRKAGLTLLLTGVESPYHTESMGKKLSVEKVPIAINILRKNGVLSIASFILGHPDDTKETIDGTVDFAIKVDPDIVMFNLFTPLPGTECYERAKKDGLLEIEDIEQYDYSYPVIRTKSLSRQEVMQLFGRAYMRFYSRPQKIRSFAKAEKPTTGTIINVVEDQFGEQTEFLSKIRKMLGMAEMLSRV